MKGVCALCDEKRELCNSHIIPAFVYKWLRKTSGGVHIRNAENPNKRVQDGYKIKLLCEGCEGLFNDWETEFSKKIFHPYNANTSIKLTYSEWYSKFCVSISWRIIQYYIVERNFLDGKDNEFKQAINQALTVWKGFLKGDIQTPGIFEQHVLPLKAIQVAPTEDTPQNINRFLLRNVELDFVVTDTKSLAMTYAKMGKFVLFGFVLPPNEKWVGSRVSVNYGRFEPKKYVLPVSVMDFLFDRARKSQKIMDKISLAQQQKIDSNVENNLDNLIDSDLLKAMLEDAKLFGEDVIIKR